MLGARQVADADLGRVGAAARGADSDHWLLAAPAPGDRHHFRAEAVAGIEHQVVPAAEQFVEVGLGEEARDRVDLDRRIDRAAALRHRLDLGATVLAGDGRQLAIGVGDAQIVGIDQGELADRGPRQRLGRPRPHPAEADHGDVARGQALDRAPAIQPVDAGESFAQVLSHQPILARPPGPPALC